MVIHVNMILIDNHNNHDPRLNLALEEFVLRNKNQGDYLLLYVNDPSVIIGKHQNVMEEVGLSFVEANGIPVVRRISGGGAVYHDQGNLNFSIITDHTPERHNNYEPFLAPIIYTLQRLGIESQLNNRNSLVLSDGRKFSGNAQFASRGRMLSHGTLLFNSDLDALYSALLPDSLPLESRAVPSIRSQVVNLESMFEPFISMKTFQQHIQQGFIPYELHIEDMTSEEWELVDELAETKYSSWEWNVGRSPQYTVLHKIAGGVELQLTIKDGIIEKIKTDRIEKINPELVSALHGMEYKKEVLSSITLMENPIR